MVYNLLPVFADLYESNKSAFQQFGINDFDFLIQESTKWSDKNVEKKRLYNSDIGLDGSKLLPFFNQMQVVEHFMDWVNKFVEDPTLSNSKGLASVSTYDKNVILVTTTMKTRQTRRTLF